MERIRQLRNEKGLSQAKLAVMADMDPATLNRLEQGKGNPNLKTIARVAGALGVEVVDLFPKVQSPLPEADEARRDAETAEKLLRFGERMAAQWELELPDRLEAEDEEWLGHTWAMYHEFIAILNSVRPGESSNKQELMGSLMDINAAAQRIVTMVQQHNERAREAGKKVLVLQETT
jgi:transcriptional regulator with XRE-family HTH domain